MNKSTPSPCIKKSDDIPVHHNMNGQVRLAFFDGFLGANEGFNLFRVIHQQ